MNAILIGLFFLVCFPRPTDGVTLEGLVLPDPGKGQQKLVAFGRYSLASDRRIKEIRLCVQDPKTPDEWSVVEADFNSTGEWRAQIDLILDINDCWVELLTSVGPGDPKQAREVAYDNNGARPNPTEIADTHFPLRLFLSSRTCYNPGEDSRLSVRASARPSAGREREEDPVYKLLLCVRYLQTRYLAFICIVSVMLGVATLIVVNAVMSGFSTKLKDRLHALLSDVVVDTDRMDGFAKYDERGFPVFDNEGKAVGLSPKEMIDKVYESKAGDRIDAISPTIEVFAILQCEFRGEMQTKPIKLIGIDPHSRVSVGGFSEYLVRQKDLANPTFELTPDALKQHDKNQRMRNGAPVIAQAPPMPLVPKPGAIPEPDDNAMKAEMPVPKLYGMIPGYSLAHFRFRNEHGQVVEEAVLKPGDDVSIITVGGGAIKPVWGTFLVSDYLKTEMSEYDDSFVYVPLEQLQAIRGMHDRCTALQIKLKNYDADKAFVTAELRKLFNSPTCAWIPGKNGRGRFFRRSRSNAAS